MKKIIAILFILAGEGISVYAEVMASKNINTFLPTFLKMFALIIVAGFCLIAGYMFGMKYIQNIWIIGVISIASIATIEPLVVYLIFRELPTRGALLGFILGVLAILSALFIK